MTVLLVEITAATDASGTTTTLRYATQGYNAPSAPGLYAEKIEDTIAIRRELRGATGGRGVTDFGDLILTNADGDLDDLADYAFDGRQIKGLLIDDVAASYGSAQTLFTATMGPASFDFERVTIPIRDRLSELDQPYHSETYAGTNSLPDGLEGTGDDIQGQPKPEPEGDILNVQPPLVNTARLIWQFSNNDDVADIVDDGSSTPQGGVYEGGVGDISREADYTSQTDMENNPPSTGAYRVWPRQQDGSGGYIGGYFRLGSPPRNTITADVQVGAGTSDRTVGQVLQTLALRTPTITSGDISASDVSALDSALPDPIGVWQPRESTVLQEMERIAEGCGVYFGFDRDGVLRMGQWSAPSGTAAATFRQADVTSGTVLANTEFDIIAFDGQPTNTNDVPVFEVIARFRRNYTPQANLRTDITAARRAIVENEWRREVDEDATVQNKHVNARSAEYDTPWADRTGAAAFATATLTRDREQRRRWSLRAALQNDLGDTVDLADVVTIVLPRYDLTGSGKKHRISAIQYDPVRGEIELEVWG